MNPSQVERWRGKVDEELKNIEVLLRNHLRHHWQFEIAIIGAYAATIAAIVVLAWR